MPSADRVVLLFGGKQLELDASMADRRGSLRLFEREAERAWDLQPKSFALFTAGGKVDSPQALQRALQVEGPCVLEVREHPEWQALNTAVKALEAQVLAKVDVALAGIRADLCRTDERVCNGLAPMVQSLAMEQLDVRAKVQSLAMEQLDVHAKVGTLVDLAQLVRTMALEQVDLRAKIPAETVPAATEQQRPAPEPLAAPQLVVYPVLAPSSPAPELKRMEELEAQLRRDLGGRVAAAEQADEFLFSEIQAMRDLTKAMQQDVQGLREEAAEQKRKQRGPDDWLQWDDGLPASLPYSGKIVVGGQKPQRSSKRIGGRGEAEAAALFARGPSLRPGCQSLPLLPPLK